MRKHLMLVAGLHAIYKPGFNYSKAGVMLLDLQDSSIEQKELDLEPEPVARGELIATIDKINNRYSRRTLQVASSGLEGKKRSWAMRQELLTPQYTTRGDSLPVAVA